MNRTPMLIASTLLAFTLVGCGGDASRPSVDELSEALGSDADLIGTQDLDDDVTTCIAEALEGSDASDEVLRALADGDEDYEPSGDDEETLTNAITEAIPECVGTP